MVMNTNVKSKKLSLKTNPSEHPDIPRLLEKLKPFFTLDLGSMLFPLSRKVVRDHIVASHVSMYIYIYMNT